MGNAMFTLWGINSIYFNGVNSYIDCGNSELFNSLNFTVEFWISFHNVTKRQMLIIKWESNKDMLLELSDSRSKCLEWQLNKYQRDNVYSDALEIGKPYHIVACVDSTAMYLYVDGELVSSKIMDYQPRIINDKNLYLGANKDGTQNFLEADVYLVALYNACWNEATVAGRYAVLSQDIVAGQDIVPSNCVLFYNSIDISNPIIDRSGSGNHGILHNIESSIRRVRKLRRKQDDGFVAVRRTTHNSEGWRRINT